MISSAVNESNWSHQHSSIGSTRMQQCAQTFPSHANGLAVSFSCYSVEFYVVLLVPVTSYTLFGFLSPEIYLL